VGFTTDVGLVRERNEDAYSVFLPYAGEDNEGPVDAVFAVADGMGGHEGGDLAGRFVAQAVDQELAVPAAASPRDMRAWLLGFLRRVNRELLALGTLRGAAKRLGSTLTMTALRDGRLYVAHVGDSRLYLLTEEGLLQLTPDHSWVAEQLRSGGLTPEEAAHHPERNLLTECLGVDEHLDPFIAERSAGDGERYLLCSDGVHGAMTDTVIARVLAEELDPQRAAARLIELAREAGGQDNATAVVFDVRSVSALATTLTGSAPETPAGAGARRRIGPVTSLAALRRAVRMRSPKLLLLGGSALFVVALIVGGWLLFASPGARDGDPRPMSAAGDTVGQEIREESGPAAGSPDPAHDSISADQSPDPPSPERSASP
jgi:protein phosphatase